jgi:uncharacterized protein YjbK
MEVTMQKSVEVEFKTLLSKEEYERLMEQFKGNRMDLQTNHYFDTSRFSLKALDASLRVRERESLELTLKRKKGYIIQEFNLPITKEIFEEIKTTGVLPEGELKNEVNNLIGEQKINNFLSLSTLRMFFSYNNGVLFIDKSHYLGITDYELEYEAKSYHAGKKEFVQIINELGIQYRKSEKKVKRAYNAYKRIS